MATPGSSGPTPDAPADNAPETVQPFAAGFTLLKPLLPVGNGDAPSADDPLCEDGFCVIELPEAEPK